MATLNITVSVTSNIVSHLTIPEPLDQATGKNVRKMSENYCTLLEEDKNSRNFPDEEVLKCQKMTWSK